jgi:hypothetical protein
MLGLHRKNQVKETKRNRIKDNDRKKIADQTLDIKKKNIIRSIQK